MRISAMMLCACLRAAMCAATFAATFSATAAEPAPRIDAQSAFDDFGRLADQQPPGDLPEGERGLWYRLQFLKVCDAADRFIRQFPDDPLRWRVLELYAVYTSNLESIVSGLRARVDELISQALTASDISDTGWQQAKAQQISALLRRASASADAGQPVDLGPVRRALDELAQRYPASGMSPILELTYADLLGRQSPSLAGAWLEHLAAGPNEEVAKLASGQIGIRKLREAPLDLTFTALDGRVVDLAALRGKVVLIDFWATWCGPCVAELPNIRAVYDDYHAKGFEVIGVSLDRLEDEQKLRDFIAARKIPWPQHFDGGRSNALAEKYGIFRIPTQLLLGTDGRLVNDSARGEILRTEVARLLGG